MENDITIDEAMIFAVAVHEVINKVKPVMPNIVIMETASRVDFASNTLAEDVRRFVEQLTEVSDE